MTVTETWRRAHDVLWGTARVADVAVRRYLHGSLVRLECRSYLFNSSGDTSYHSQELALDERTAKVNVKWRRIMQLYRYLHFFYTEQALRDVVEKRLMNLDSTCLRSSQPSMKGSYATIFP